MSTAQAISGSPLVSRADAASKAEKLQALRKWSHSSIQDDLRFRLAKLQDRIDFTSELPELIPVGQILKQLKPELEKAKQLLVNEINVPAESPESDGKFFKVKAEFSTLLAEAAMVLREVQNLLTESSNEKEIFTVAQLVKTIKATLDSMT